MTSLTVLYLLVVGPSVGCEPVRPEEKQLFDDILGEIRHPMDTALDPWRGNRSSLDSIVIYSSYTCPHCSLMNDEVYELLLEDEEALVYYRHYPLDMGCDLEPNGPNTPHAGAHLAAIASRAAQRQSMFFAMHDALYMNQLTNASADLGPQFTSTQLRRIAQSIGLDLAEYDRYVGSPATMDWLKQHVKTACELVDENGNRVVAGTPVLFFNGREIDLEELARYFGRRASTGLAKLFEISRRLRDCGLATE